MKKLLALFALLGLIVGASALADEGAAAPAGKKHMRKHHAGHGHSKKAPAAPAPAPAAPAPAPAAGTPQ